MECMCLYVSLKLRTKLFFQFEWAIALLRRRMVTPDTSCNLRRDCGLHGSDVGPKIWAHHSVSTVNSTKNFNNISLSDDIFVFRGVKTAERIKIVGATAKLPPKQ